MDSDSDSEVQRILQVRKHGSDERPEAPPSSYGSMKSDEEEYEEDMTEAGTSLAKPEVPGATSASTLLQLNRSESPETHYTEVTQPQSLSARKQGAYITDSILEDDLEEDEVEKGSEEWEEAPPDSPEPPPIEETEDQSMSVEPSEDSRLGQLHPELDLPYIFKSIQSSLSNLTEPEMFEYKRHLCWRKTQFIVEQLLECDTLDLVDKIIEAYGKGVGLQTAIQVLNGIEKPELAEELTKTCKRAVLQSAVKAELRRKHNMIHEGVPRAGQQVSLNLIYMEPQISTCGYGGINPFHEIRGKPPPPQPQVPSPETFIGGNDIFRCPSRSPVAMRTVLTTGLPGIGLSVAVQKFIMDWCKDLANRDIQFIFKIKFRDLWVKMTHHMEPGETLTFMEMLTYFYSEVDGAEFVDKQDCKALFILDGIDMFKTQLDFKGTPVVSDIHMLVSLDSLVVNLIRGSLVPYSLVWITGRRAATTQIPAEFIHKVYEIQGYSDEMKDEFLIKRSPDREIANQVITRMKHLPTLHALCQMPFMTWIISMVFERGKRNEPHFGEKPPKLTPFYIHHLVVQTNRKLEKYYGAPEDVQHWSEEDREFLIKLGKMALKLIEKECSVFHEEDMKKHSLDLVEVAVYSGIVTELPGESYQRRTFSFIHYTFQEFMAALYVFLSFRLEGKNVLDQSSRMSRLFKDRAVVDLLRTAIDRTLNSPYGQYDMFLRFLCGLVLRVNKSQVLRGLFVPYDTPLLKNMEEGSKLLQKRMETAASERQHNLEECLRELTQKED